MWRLLRMAALAEKGHWPVAGGVGDQTARCVELFEAVWAEQARVKAERMTAERNRR